MKILFATSECAPFIKSGGLGDVACSLPKALGKIKGNQVAVVLPYYSSIKYNPNIETQYVTSFYMPLAWRDTYVGIFKMVVKSTGVGKNKREDLTYYFIDNEYYFGRNPNLYGYSDDGERFAFFSKAVLEFLNYVDFSPQIIHCNDWQTGFIPLYLKAFFDRGEKFKNIRTVFTIHNIEYQGKADPDFLSNVLGVDEKWRNIATYDGLINALKCALVLSDKITTVSDTYSHEIQHAYFAHGMENILRENRYKTLGIVNGIDTNLYNPKTDETIAQNFSPSDISGKDRCKEELQREFELPQNPHVPVIAMVTRLVSHKGLELVERIFGELMSMNVQLVVLGTGDKKYEDLFNYFSYSHSEKFSAKITFDPYLANKVYAGADFFLMPSKSEPCGLSQLIAMRYGTIPIVRETGGLVDTVPPINIQSLEGKGFTFKVYNAHDMLGAIKRAVEFYEDKESLKKIRANIMRYDSSWRTSAELYNGLYMELCGIRDENV